MDLRPHTHTPLLLREPKEAIYGDGSVPGFEADPRHRGCVRGEKGAHFRESGPDSNPFIHREGPAIAAACQPSRRQPEAKGLYRCAHTRKSMSMKVTMSGDGLKGIINF